MKVVVVYESHWGNTKQVAEAVAEGLSEGTGTDVRALNTGEAAPEVLADADLIVAGAPIYGFSLPRESQLENLPNDKKAPRPADIEHPSMRTWLKTVPEGNGRAAGFDTRLSWSPGSAAKKIRKELAKAGYAAAGDDGEFLVEGTYGPMRDGELDRAREWGAALARAVE